MVIIMNKKTFTLVVAIAVIVVVLISLIFFYYPRESTIPTALLSPAPKPIEQGIETSDYIAFACNVDWGNEVIPELLQVLEEKETTITFFVTGRWAETYPELFQTIVDKGHEIGSHGYQHLNYGNLSYEKNEEEIKRAETVIMKTTQDKPTYFAPPSGAYNESTLRAAEKLGYKTVLWSIDTIDWRQGSTKEVIINRVMGKEALQGKIVLMHPMAETVKALPELIEQLKGQGITVGRVSDVL